MLLQPLGLRRRGLRTQTRGLAIRKGPSAVTCKGGGAWRTVPWALGLRCSVRNRQNRFRGEGTGTGHLEDGDLREPRLAGKALQPVQV